MRYTTPDLEEVQIDTADEATDFAIEWQGRMADESCSWLEVLEWGAFFERLARYFDLMEEFKENGII